MQNHAMIKWIGSRENLNRKPWIFPFDDLKVSWIFPLNPSIEKAVKVVLASLKMSYVTT